jgi:tight adherence protein C
MNSQFVSLVIALCAGISVGCISKYILNKINEIEVEKNRKYEHPMPILMRIFLPFIPPFRAIANRKSFAQWRKNIAPKLAMAGYGEDITPLDFIALRLLMFFVAIIFLFIGSFSSQVSLPWLIAILLALYPSLWLNATIKARQLSIMKALPNLLDLLTLSVESGRDLLTAMREILARRKMDPLGEELSATFQEIQFGRPRTEALRALANRVKQSDLTATINAIIQADELGVSIAQQLKIQSDMQRTKRFALAEKLANEASVKIILPVVIFILPSVFIVLLGPLILQTIRMFQ